MATQNVVLSIPAGNNLTYVGNPPNDDYVITDTGGGDYTITLGNGIDQLTLLGGNNTLSLGDGADQIVAGDGNNTMTLGNGNSQITVGNGNDTISVGTGSNTIVLGAGLDSVSTEAGGNVVSVSGAAVSGDTLKGALTSGDGSTNQLVLTAAGTMSPVNVSGFASYQLADGGPNSLTLSEGNFDRLPGGVITVRGGDSGNTIDAAALSAAHAVTVFAGSGTDILTGGAGDDTFVFAPGNTSGDTADGGTGINTLDLAAGGAGTLNGLGTSFINISTVFLDTNATWSLGISDSTAFTGTIFGFGPADTLDLATVAFDPAGSAQLLQGNVLQITENSSIFTVNLDPNQDLATSTFHLAADSGTGTSITEQVCFCRGTLILTDEGEVPVEDLTVGGRVKTLSGNFKPIRWIGFGRDLVTRTNPLARPIIVRAGALADNVPRRDLYLTHGHSLFFEGALIPVEHLVNHRSIQWDDTARVVEYYHIELADHDVVFAEGAPAESFYDAGNRAFFQNIREGSQAAAARPMFAPVLNAGESVERVWAALFERAGGQVERATTDDPDLHLVVDGARLDPASIADCVYTFVLAHPPAGTLRLSSRCAVPSLLGLNRQEHRRLGVAIRQIILQQPGVMTCLDYDGPVFAAGGCHRAESGHSWTDGELSLPASLFAHLTGTFTLLVQTSRQTMHYPIAAPDFARRVPPGQIIN